MYVESRLFNSEFPGVEYVGIQYDIFEKEKGGGSVGPANGSV